MLVGDISIVSESELEEDYGYISTFDELNRWIIW